MLGRRGGSGASSNPGMAEPLRLFGMTTWARRYQFDEDAARNIFENLFGGGFGGFGGMGGMGASGGAGGRPNVRIFTSGPSRKRRRSAFEGERAPWLAACLRGGWP